MTAMNNTNFYSNNRSMRHSTPMSFFGADFCAQANDNVILSNTVLSVLLFVLSLVAVLLPVVILSVIILVAVIIPLAVITKQNKKLSYYKYKAE